MLKPIFSALDNKTIQGVDWDKTQLEELDIRGTELSEQSIISILTRLQHLRWLDASWLENFTDKVIEEWMEAGTISTVQYLSLDTCDSLSENSLTEMIVRHGHQFHAMHLGGQHKVLEEFCYYFFSCWSTFG